MKQILLMQLVPACENKVLFSILIFLFVLKIYFILKSLMWLDS